MELDRYEVALAVGGLAALVAAWFPAYSARRPVSAPIALLGLGVVLFAVLPRAQLRVDPRDHLELTERLTELGVIVSLMVAGLGIDRRFGFQRWTATWRMLGIAMPLTIVLAMLLGGTIGGFAPAGALLLGALVSSTDPMLASDVQVGGPSTTGHRSQGTEDDVRFTLTSEGGLNDALAFPFVYGAIELTSAERSDVGLAWWLAWNGAARVAIAVAVGWVIGRLIGTIAFRPVRHFDALAEASPGFVALATTMLAYGCTQLLQGYGFLAVFVAAITLRDAERHHEYQRRLHDFMQQTETLLVVGLLVLFGGALVDGLLTGLTAAEAVLAAMIVLVARPLSGLAALIGSDFSKPERYAVSFFGIRGVASVYYLAYALGSAPFADSDALWRTVAATVVMSITVHGILATPWMSRVDQARRRINRTRIP